ncbi:PREDICTED: uncharacterized protein LOC106808106 [Priapulus caudatus]|uniref:Uncharacterized protein LOC106808106 n=1 Tax=Priapulus caudatus TaxID=37621 RepID=A0ABM1E1U6_PRICU|nr:PREDICTED: uncharacterized protein LOC106808106 [Priapulus caudatus]
MTASDELAITDPLPSMGFLNNGERMTAIAMLLVGAVALIALVLGAVSLSRGPAQININGQGTTPGGAGTAAAYTGTGGGVAVSYDKLWMFAIGHDFSPYEYQNDQGYTQGFNVDLIDAVCREAGVKCSTVYDDYNNCWNGVPGKHPLPGPGLMGRWYDACTGWSQHASRLNSVGFTNPWTGTGKPSFMILKNNPDGFNNRDVTGKKIGFLDGWIGDENCLTRQTAISGNQLTLGQIKHYKDLADAMKAMQSKEIAALFHSTGITYDQARYEFIGVESDYTSCTIAGLSMMTRKDSALAMWWNPAFGRIKEKGIFQRICEDATKNHIKTDENIACIQ